ncbi:unnamed protein product [Rotaria sordida]|uniref:EGF-like domain-containing protein n=1 Tax=Rotaria sordida TaxID=392033 RepID=A0A818LI65_9BILA|nr:unnamed protein product [Rotaria sordida]CAF3573102.1 unnamed protein product [Rotaria sordida]
MTTSRTSMVNIHCPPSSSHGWQVESGYYSDSYNNSSSSMSNTKQQTSIQYSVHPTSSSCCTSLIPPPPSTNLFHRSSCHKRHHQTTKDIILCSCTHHPYLQHKINVNNNPNVTTNAALLCTIDRCIHSNTNMKPISEHYIEQSNSSLNDSNTSPPITSNDDEESGSHSGMDSTVLSPLLTPPQIPPPLPPPHPPMIPVDHTTLLSQIKTTTRNSILLCGDNTSTTTNAYMADSGFDSSSSHAVAPSAPPPIPSSTPCTAFMIQTQTGNALLIPHAQGTLMSSSTIDPNVSNINNGTLPLRSSAYSCPNSTQLTTTMSTIDRPHSNLSNVYQTIDADSFRNNCYVYPLDHHHHHSHSHIRCNCDSTTYNEQTTTTTRQSTHSPCPLFNNSSCRLKKRKTDENYFQRNFFSWKTIAIIFILTTLCFLISTIYLSIMHFYHPTFREINLTQPKIRQQNLFYGKTTRFIRIGDKIKETIDSQSSTQLQFYIERTTSIQFNFTANRQANFGIYGKRSNSPSLTQFDFFHSFHENPQQQQHHLVRRSLSQNRTSQIYITNFNDEQLILLFNELLTTGLWYITIINDGLFKEKFQLSIEHIDQKNERTCLNNCNNHGICQHGICICYPSYTGSDCSIAQCTDLCSGHGVIEYGQCRCQEGWHGAECQLMSNQCEISNCNNRGTCIAGQCVCQSGYQGKFCEQISCQNVNCSDHGICIEGKCRCFHGYTNDDCSLLIHSQCDNRCSEHGQYVDYPKSMCICDNNWTGEDCSQPKCNIDCGIHGKCSMNNKDKCQCDDGWIGENCMKKICSRLCKQCDNNGTCLCQNGYTGRYCQIDACPNNCNGHGECKINKCICHTNWFGPECQFTIENNCNDQIDNDNDGLIDCLDPDCCSSSRCQSTIECISRTTAKDILLRRQAPSPSASFFERMQFLIQEDGLQTSSIYTSFNERRASVIRGQIFYKKFLPLNGVKVQVFNNPNQGYTISDKDGFFNLLINGGGSVLIQFIRQPFQTKQYAFIVPWNTFLHIGYIYMDEIIENNMCHRNLSEILQPKLWDTSLDRSFITNNKFDYAYTLGSQIIRQSISIDKNDLPIKFIYLSSSSTRRYQSILTIVLTGDYIDDDLIQIHLSISIEGIFFMKKFHADTNLIYEYEWSRRNAYDQNVHGLAEAIVSIGYEYVNCNQIDWYRKSVKITGQDIPTANIGGWTFNVHHKLNIQSGILHKGDGTNMLLTDSPLQFSTLIGMRDQSRSIDCRNCYENPALLTKLLNPTSLTVSNDGTIYIGDLNIIWMYRSTNNLVKPVLELNEQYTYKYYLTTDPVDGRLYISDYHRRQIIRLIKTDSIENLKQNYEIVVGDGHYCTLDLIYNITCGDEQLAKHVSLSYPKGLTIDRYGTIYFIDGQRIRKLSIDNSHVTNLIGSYEYQIDYHKQLSCNRTYSLDQFKLYNPTTLHIHPLDGDLYVLDDMYLYRIRINFNLIEIILGQSLNCLNNENFIQLNNPIDFSFNYQGDLFILEKFKPFIRVLRSSNNQLENLNLNLNNIKINLASIINYPDGSIILTNIPSKEIFKLKSISLTNEDEQNNGLNIHSTDKNEIYVFNRVGQHRATIDALTGETIFNFTYDSPQNAYGKLESINYRNGKSLLLKYDYAMRINDIIQMPSGNKLKINFSKQKFFSYIIDDNGLSTQFLYDNGLLTGIIKNNIIRNHFIYNKAGHIQQIIHEDGYYNELITSANHSFYRIDIINPNENTTYLMSKSKTIQLKNNKPRLIRRDLSNSTIVISTLNPLVKLISSSNRSLTLKSRHQTIEFNSTFQFSNSLIYSVLPYDNEQIRSCHLKINNNIVLTMLFDHFEKKLIIQDYKQNEILTMMYSDKYRLKSINTRGFLPISYTYKDNDQKLSSWKIGLYYEEFLYDTRGRLIEIQRFNDLASIKYSYGNGEQPVGITYGSQSSVMLRKDSTGSITGIIMPNQAEHTIEYRTYFNGYRLIYSGLHTQIWEYDSKSNLQRIYFPFQRIITYKYDENNRLIYSFTDGCKISYKYLNFQKQIHIEYPRGQIYEQIYEYNNNNSLLNNFIDYYYDKYSYIILFIKYNTINSFELRLIFSKEYHRNFLENYSTIYQLNYTLNYNENFGYLQSSTFIRLTYPTIYECYIKDNLNFITISRRIDEYKRLKEINFNYKNQKRLNMEFIYNNKQLLLEQIKISLNELEKYTYIYEYDYLKRLINIKKNQNSIDYYQYDLNNNLNLTKSYQSIQYNQWNQIIQIITNDNLTLNYKYDLNGFLHIISNNKLYLFNSYGLLIKYKYNQLIIDYIYDNEQRLIMKLYPLTGYYLRFIYGNQQQRKLITHIYNSQLKFMTIIHYDNQNNLIGFEQNDKKFFILTDSIGSPLFIYDNNGLLIQEKFYGLYGQILTEKNFQDKIFFPFGYAGLLIDEDLNCAFEKFHGKLYDLNLGRYLVPNFPLTWINKQTYLPNINNPLNDMNLYKINDEIYNINEIFFQRLHQNDILSQLQNLNYDFTNLYDSMLSSPYFNNQNTILEDNSLIYSSFFSYFNEHYTINYPNKFTYSIAHIQNENDFWINRTLSINSNNQIEFISFTLYDDLFSILFNQSYLIPYRQQNHIYVLQNLNSYQQLKSYLNQPLFHQFKINIRQQTNINNLIDMDLIISNTTIFHIKFGSTYDDEYQYLIDNNLSQMIKNVWQYERTYLMENFRLYYLYTWSQNEIDELISNGYLTNYTIVYRYDPLIYPEIIDDPTNFIFKMKT